MSSLSSPAVDLKVAVRHARLRWIGAPLLITGMMLLIWAFLGFASGGSGWSVMLGCFGLGTALASFGANHDTAIAHAVRVRGEAGLPEELRAEVEKELSRDRADTLSLRPSAAAGMVVPVVCVAVQTYLAWRLLGG